MYYKEEQANFLGGVGGGGGGGGGANQSLGGPQASPFCKALLQMGRKPTILNILCIAVVWRCLDAN